MEDKTFEGYRIMTADISELIEDSKRTGQHLYNICLTLESIGCDIVDPNAYEIWKQEFNRLARHNLSCYKEELERARKKELDTEGADVESLLPWNDIGCCDDNHNLLSKVPVIYVRGTDRRAITKYSNTLKNLVKHANYLAQQEIDKANQEKKQLEEEREKLKQFNWD